MQIFPPGGCEHDGLLVPGYDRLEEVQQHAVLALASHLQEGELQGVGDLQTRAFIHHHSSFHHQHCHYHLRLHVQPDQGRIRESRLSEVHQQLGQGGGEENSLSADRKIFPTQP